MTTKAALERLRAHEIQPTPQRLAIAQWILDSRAHPTADEVWQAVKTLHPTLSRATVYNTLNLFVEKRLLRTQVLREGNVVFDPHVAAHHHFIDEDSGEIRDIPFDALPVSGKFTLPGYEIHEFQIILRGRKHKSKT